MCNDPAQPWKALYWQIELTYASTLCDLLKQKVPYHPCYKLLVLYKYYLIISTPCLFKSSSSIYVTSMTQPLLIIRWWSDDIILLRCTCVLVPNKPSSHWLYMVCSEPINGLRCLTSPANAMDWNGVARLFYSFLPKWLNQSCACLFFSSSIYN